MESFISGRKIMKHSYREAIERLSEDAVICPLCASKNLISTERSDEEGTRTSYRCVKCGQQFALSVQLVWCCAVEYKDYVGDTVRPDAPLSEML